MNTSRDYFSRIGPGCQLTTRVETITKPTALEMLKHNDANPRKRVNWNHVKAIAADMKAERWMLNGEPIVFDADGNLKDGQHRLQAIVMADVSVSMLVVRGVDPNVDLFDFGLKRKLGQTMGVSNNVETLARVITSNAYSVSMPPTGIAESYVTAHLEQMREAIAIAYQGGNKGWRVVGNRRDTHVPIYMLIRFGENANELRQFMGVVNSQFGIDGRECSPAIVLYKYLWDKRSHKTRASVLEGIETFLCAYGDFKAGKPRRKAYAITSTTRAAQMLRDIRVMDGLEGIL